MTPGTAANKPDGKATLFVRAATVAACAAILFARMPDRFLNPQFYAEDAYFYVGALHFGGRYLVMPYFGYLLLMPKFGCWIATTFRIPPLWVPALFNGIAFATTLLVLWRICSPRVSLPRAPLLALAVVLFPKAEDLFLVLENIQWVAALALLAMIISRDPDTPAERWGDRVGAAAIGLTGVNSILLLPLFVIRALVRKTSESAILAAVVGATALIQGWFVVHGETLRGNPPSPFDPALIPHILGLHFVVRMFNVGTQPDAMSAGVAAAGWCAAALFALGCLRSRPDFGVPGARKMLFGAFVIFLAGAIYRFHDMLRMFVTDIELERYFFVPGILFVWLIVTDLASKGFRRGAAIGLLGAYLATSACGFRVRPYTDYHWKDYAEGVARDLRVTAPINPSGWFLYYDGRRGSGKDEQ